MKYVQIEVRGDSIKMKWLIILQWHQINIQAGKAKMTIFFKYMSGSELLAPFGKYEQRSL